MKNLSQLPASLDGQTLSQGLLRDISRNANVSLNGFDAGVKVPIEEPVERQRLRCHLQGKATLAVRYEEAEKLSRVPL